MIDVIINKEKKGVKEESFPKLMANVSTKDKGLVILAFGIAGLYDEHLAKEQIEAEYELITPEVPEITAFTPEQYNKIKPLLCTTATILSSLKARMEFIEQNRPNLADAYKLVMQDFQTAHKGEDVKVIINETR